MVDRKPARTTCLPSLDVGPLVDQPTIEAFVAILDTIADAALRTDPAALDPISSDVVLTIVAELQKHARMLRAASNDSTSSSRRTETIR
jgi:hypothetical protein